MEGAAATKNATTGSGPPDRTASGSRTEDDEALARQLQRELELEDSGYVATDATALAASLFSFPAREQEREDSGRRGRR